jgi:hypothetical protein
VQLVRSDYPELPEQLAHQAPQVEQLAPRAQLEQLEYKVFREHSQALVQLVLLDRKVLHLQFPEQLVQLD